MVKKYLDDTGLATLVNNIKALIPTNLSSFTDDLGSSPTHTHSQYLTREDTGWKKATLKSGFSHSALASAGNLMYRRIGNVVYIKGSVKGFTGTVACTTLPTGYRPDTRIDFYGSESGNYIAKFQVASNGDISYLGGTRGSVANTQWFNICTSFITDDDFPIA